MRAEPNEYDAAFREAMRRLGYVEGSTLQIEYRWAAGSEQRADELAAELAASDVEVIVAATTAAIRAALRATKSIPIVMAASADPIVAGLVASHAQPGGNVTGLSMVSTDTATKRLQLVRELLPTATRVAVLLFGASAPGPSDQGNALLVEQLRTASRQLGMSLTVAGIGGPGDLADAFASVARTGAQALIVQANAVTIDHRASVVALAATHRLPAVYETEGFVDAGGLLSYGPSLADMYRRSASYVDKILKGAKPASLPIEQPDKYDLVINQKTARTLALKVPQALLVRADRLIE
ncbi:MAG TPA: ABC transporter substrate-binding protein [Caldimonas sp.]|nr:ABC transporter substrate-binding protein [Caldimonas sp.]